MYLGEFGRLIDDQSNHECHPIFHSADCTSNIVCIGRSWDTTMRDTYSVVMARNTPFYYQKVNSSNYVGFDVLVLAALTQGLGRNYVSQNPESD